MVVKILAISLLVWLMIMSVLSYFEDEHEERYKSSRTNFSGGKKAKEKSRLSDDRVHAIRNGGRSSDGYSKLSSGPAGERSSLSCGSATCWGETKSLADNDCKTKGCGPCEGTSVKSDKDPKVILNFHGRCSIKHHYN